MSKYLKIEYLFIFIVIIWNPLQVFILGFDGAGRTLIILSILVFLFKLRSKLFLTSFNTKPILWWSLWVLYSFTNTLRHGFDYGEYTKLGFLFMLLYPLLVLYLINVEFKFNREVLSNVIITSLFAYIILAIIYDNVFGYYEIAGLFLNKNIIGINCAILVFFLALKFSYKEIHLSKMFLLTSIPIVLLIVTASRKSFGMLIIIISGIFISRAIGKSLRSFVYIIIGCCLIYGFYGYVLDNTVMGERLMGTFTQIESQRGEFVTGTQLDKFGDRGYFYLRSWEIFSDNPVSGIGLGNFKLFNSRAAVNHSEYATQLSEGGIIGIFLFLLFYLWIAHGILKCWILDKKNQNITFIYIAGFVAVLFMNTAAWSYNSVSIFCVLGFIIAYIKATEEERESFEKRA
jgi:O-antigen ligase